MGFSQPDVARWNRRAAASPELSKRWLEIANEHYAIQRRHLNHQAAIRSAACRANGAIKNLDPERDRIINRYVRVKGDLT